jgi:arylsulfatase A-like enzyme
MQWAAIGRRPECHTPNINRLAEEGLLFERSQTACSVCCPSRAILCTGAYQWHNGVFNQVHSAPLVHRDMFPAVETYSQRLKDVGYRQGKWHASFLRTPLDFGYDEIAAPLAYNPRLLVGVDSNRDHVSHTPLRPRLQTISDCNDREANRLRCGAQQAEMSSIASHSG